MFGRPILPSKQIKPGEESVLQKDINTTVGIGIQTSAVTVTFASSSISKEYSDVSIDVSTPELRAYAIRTGNFNTIVGYEVDLLVGTLGMISYATSGYESTDWGSDLTIESSAVDARVAAFARSLVARRNRYITEIGEKIAEEIVGLASTDINLVLSILSKLRMVMAFIDVYQNASYLTKTSRNTTNNLRLSGNSTIFTLRAGSIVTTVLGKLTNRAGKNKLLSYMITEANKHTSALIEKNSLNKRSLLDLLKKNETQTKENLVAAYNSSMTSSFVGVIDNTISLIRSTQDLSAEMRSAAVANAKNVLTNNPVAATDTLSSSKSEDIITASGIQI
jgi:hypothetical protein